MKLQYFPETDSLYIELKYQPGVEVREVADGLNVDLDTPGCCRLRHRPRLNRFDLTTLESSALTVTTTRAA
jgi:hypothetical protein